MLSVMQICCHLNFSSFRKKKIIYDYCHPWTGTNDRYILLTFCLENLLLLMIVNLYFLFQTISSVSCFFFAHYDADTTNATTNLASQCNCVLHGIEPNGNDSPVTLLLAFRAPDQPQNCRGTALHF